MKYGAETWTLTKQAHYKLAPAHTRMERSIFNITYKDRSTNMWVRERTKVIYIMYTVRKMKWSWAGYINRLKDNRWTWRVTTWRPYDKNRRQGTPAKRWRDDPDKYWKKKKKKKLYLTPNVQYITYQMQNWILINIHTCLHTYAHTCTYTCTYTSSIQKQYNINILWCR